MEVVLVKRNQFLIRSPQATLIRALCVTPISEGNCVGSSLKEENFFLNPVRTIVLAHPALVWCLHRYPYDTVYPYSYNGRGADFRYQRELSPMPQRFRSSLSLSNPSSRGSDLSDRFKREESNSLS